MLSHSSSVSLDSRLSHPLILLLCCLLAIANFIFADVAWSDEEFWIYTVRPGDTLSDLSQTYCNNPDDWRILQSINAIGNDRRIPVGSKLQFPLSLLKYQPADAAVTAVSGLAFIIKHDQLDPIPLTTKQRLQIGDMLVTGNNTRITILFADGSELIVLSNSEVSMDTLSAWGSTGMVDTRIHLQGGRVETHVKPSKGPGSRYEIITPAAVAAVRGTKFRVSADKVQSLMRSEVTQGAVAVKNAYSESNVNEGFGQLAKKGEKLAPPRALLPATDLQNNQSVHHRSPIHFTWPEIEGRIVYQIHLSSKTGVQSFKIGKPELALDNLDDGEYTLSVRGIDDLGLQGLNAAFIFHVFNPPEAPSLSGDIENKVIRIANPTLAWSSVNNAHSYKLQLADNPDFHEPLIDEVVNITTYTPSTGLVDGKYYWRVASIDSSQQSGHYSSASAFSIYPQPTSPTAINAEVKPAFIDVSWTATNGTQTYEIQLAKDDSFTSIVGTTSTLSSQGMLARPTESGTYFIRLRSSNTIGEYSQYSPVQAIEVTAPDQKPLWLYTVPALLLLLL